MLRSASNPGDSNNGRQPAWSALRANWASSGALPRNSTAPVSSSRRLTTVDSAGNALSSKTSSVTVAKPSARAWSAAAVDITHLADAEAQLEVAEYKHAHSKLMAPFDAIVVSVHVNEGQYLNNHQQAHTLVSLARQGRYLTRFDVPASVLNTLEIGDSIKIDSNAKTYSGNISTISYQRSQQDGAEDSRYEITAEFSSADEKLLLDQEASVNID